MTEDNTTEAGQAEGESNSEGSQQEESPVIKDLRKQLKDAQRELKSVPSRSEIEAEVLAAVARTSAIETELVGLNLPKGLSETVEGKLGDADVTREGVVEALTAIGFEITDSPDGGEESQQTEQNVQDLSQVANLGSQVAQAATGQNTDNLTDKINEAETPAQLAEIMREAGLGQ